MVPVTPAPAMGVSCPWCRQYYPAHPGHECRQCGGPLPSPPGMALGTPPAPGPRRLPTEYEKKVLFSQNPAAVIGTAFAGFGCLFLALGVFLLIVFWPIGLAFFAFGALFGGIGWALRTSSRKSPLLKLDALKNGVPAQGQLVSVSQNTYESLNGHHPWQLDYVFQVNGQMVSGSATGYDPINGLRRPGQEVWVVHLPHDPSVSSLWPPLS